MKIEKADVATKILLAGSILWVGGMVFRSDQNLKKSLSELGEAKKEIKNAQTNIDSARHHASIVKSDLANLSSAAIKAVGELNNIRYEREKMKANFEDLLRKNSQIINNTKNSYENTKQARLNLLREINLMNLEREKNVQ